MLARAKLPFNSEIKHRQWAGRASSCDACDHAFLVLIELRSEVISACSF
jgi:hypothetical protein